MANKKKHPKVGDYVLATNWLDKNPNDPWFVGLVETVVKIPAGLRYKLDGSDRFWRHAFNITKEEGEAWMNEHQQTSSEDFRLVRNHG